MPAIPRDMSLRAIALRAIAMDLRGRPSLSIVDGKPDRGAFGVGPGDPMAAMRGDEKKVPCPQDARLRFAFEQESGRSGDHQHPLGPVLVVPEPGRARLAG